MASRCPPCPTPSDCYCDEAVDGQQRREVQRENGRGKRTGAQLGRVHVRFVAVPDSAERLAAVGDVVMRVVTQDSDRRMMAAGGRSR